MSFDLPSEMHDRVGRDQRRAHIARATLVAGGGEPRDVIIRNMSEFGLGGMCRTIVPIKGETVLVRLPGDISVQGTVRWVKGQSFGVALDARLATAEVEDAIHRKVSEPAPGSTWQIEDRHRVYTPQIDPTRLRRV